MLAPEALADYMRCYQPGTIRAVCEDYRAAATFDLRTTKRIAAAAYRCPCWRSGDGEGMVDDWYDVLAIWRDWAFDVRGRALDCGHYLAEEAPAETYGRLLAFLA